MLNRIRDGSPLVRAAARLPTTVQTKLLLALIGTSALLVIVGVLGIRVMYDANDRIARLGTLQARATAYGELGTVASELRALLGIRAGGHDGDVYAGVTDAVALSGPQLVPIDTTIGTAVRRFAPDSDLTRLGFVPSIEDQHTLQLIRQDSDQLATIMSMIIGYDQVGDLASSQSLQHEQAEPIARDLESMASGLLQATSTGAQGLIDDNARSLADSQLLFAAIAIVSVVVTLLIGYSLSWSIVGPIRLIAARLSAIASGDFTGQVSVPNRDELGSLAASVNVMNGELARLYRELESVSSHKSEFLANMSHELRTPLNAIIGFSDVLSQRMYGDLNDRQLTYVDDIRSAGRHLLSLINDVLDLSKVEAGRMELQLGPVSLPDILQSGLAVVRERATRSGVEVSLDVALGRTVVVGDERKIRQVLFNLLSNAVEFTPAGGHIAIRARDDAGGVEVSVQDDGIGIAPEEQDRIFEAFQQVDGGLGGHGGTGLGLGLARRFVELHGGELRLDSNVGSGSTFTMRLPTLGSPGTGAASEAVA